MKKKYIILGIIVAVLLVILSCFLFARFNGLVFVDNRLKPNIQLYFDENGEHIFVPVIETLCELGYEKILDSNDIIELQKDDQILAIDLNELSLTCPQSPVNCIWPMPGNSYYFSERKGNEILLDSVTFAGTLSCIDCSYIIVFDDPQARIIKYKYHERMDFEQIREAIREMFPEEEVLPEGPDIITEAQLIVNGVDITEGNYVRINHTAKNTELPILAILRELGYDAQMVYDDSRKSYRSKIDGDLGRFITEYEDYGVPFAIGERGCVRKIENNDFIIDGNCINSILYWGYGTDVTVDFDTSTIYVDSCDPWA